MSIDRSQASAARGQGDEDLSPHRGLAGRKAEAGADVVVERQTRSRTQAVASDRRAHTRRSGPPPVAMSVGGSGRSVSVGTPVAQLEAVLAAMADAVVVYDMDGRIMASNDALAAMLGLNADAAFAQLSLWERGQQTVPRTPEGRPLTPDEYPAARMLAGEELRGERAMDLIVTARDGREVALNVTGGPLRDEAGRLVGAVVVLRDVTERWRLERELATRAAELETIFTTQVEGVVLVAADGRIVRMNEAQRQLLIARGVDPASERIETWAPLVPPHDAQGRPFPREQLPYYRALRGETVTGEQAVELYQRTWDGGELVLRISGAPVRDAQGHILGAVLTSYDVTPQRLLERQRLDIMRVVVHDLTNPVAALKLYLQTQQRRLAHGQLPFPPGDELHSQMGHALTRMQRLLDDLRVATTVELGTLEMHPVQQDLAALCREEAVAQQAVTGRVVHVQAPPQPVWAEVDRERIGQVIANLLSNALKYSPADRPVEVTVEIAGGAEGAGGADGMVRVAVRDEGPGIPAPEQQHVFEQFHRVAGIKAHDGSASLGLGLYISKAIVAQHGGEMGVESTVGQGSTFWFSLPLATAT